MFDLKDRKVLVLGLGDTGLSMTRWLARHGARVSVADSRAAPPNVETLARELPQVSVTPGAFRHESFTGIDLIAISPGVDRRESQVARAIKHGVPIAGDVELFAQGMRAAGAAPKVIAITGSNGKSTVTEMAGAMCRAAQLNTLVAGNIGLPVLDALSDIEAGKPAPDAVVLELSSFQLESTNTLDADAAAMLNLSEDHLDRYDSMRDYAAAKARVFAGGGMQVLNRDDAGSLGMARAGRVVETFGLNAPKNNSEWGLNEYHGRQMLARGETRLMAVDELPVAGLHNAANAMAAAALCRAISISDASITQALRAFKGLPHRAENINKINNIQVYDDSKGTNVGATVAALTGMPQRVVLIAGGDGKGQDFSPLTVAVAARARAVVLIGRDAPLIAQVLKKTGVPLLNADSMDEAVRIAYRAAQAGDAVLLSPACASYDMFKSYVHRAQVFVECVRKLREAEGA